MTDPIQAQVAALRRAQILDAAAAVFAAKGFHPTTIKDIAREAGVADGTIYNYFGSKSDLLLGIFERMRAAVRPEEMLPPPAGGDLRAVLAAMLAQPLLALKKDNFELFRIVVSEMLVNEELGQRYYQEILAPTLSEAEPLLQQWIDQGKLRPVDAPLAARALIGLVMGLMLQHALGDPLLEGGWEEMPAFLADLFLHGMGMND